ncbi:M-phase inducer phosphatase isoform X2 [Anastrepha ludens]|uniref:M-phase inducer phosphatase isoform X2 n=1 Tax=Anastrepha ludens TaxID=28586 RepID=UPI0023AEE5CA|nr:M-phase inducer phosphatase isoform X2 [Anastrepha ludens]
MQWDTIEEEAIGEMDLTSQMPHGLEPGAVSVAAAGNNNASPRRTHNLSIMNTMAHSGIDYQLSFYDDDERINEAVPRLPSTTIGMPRMRPLLSPEGSPCRFQFAARSRMQRNRRDANANGENVRNRPSIASRLQKLQNANTQGSNTAQAPSKSLRIFHSLSSDSRGSSSMEEDDMELFDMESMQHSAQSSNSMPKVPSDLDSLFIGQIKNFFSPAHRPDDEQSELVDPLRTPEMRRPPVRRCLSMTDNYPVSPNTPETLLRQVQETATSPFGLNLLTTHRSNGTISYSFKRPEPPSKTNSPVQIKRHRTQAEKENLDDSLTTMLVASPQQVKVPSHPPPLRKSMSMNDADIMSAIARSENKDEPQLIGDFSKPHVLPLMEGRHRDLKSISCNTMARLLRGEFSDVVSSYRVIDCRYPYEYAGGHIRGAENLYTHEQIIGEFASQQKTAVEQQSQTATDNRRNIIIFHCEFSSERGPKLSRFLRSTDRERNTNCYPALDYPEIYLLHNGYKEFYEQYSELCDPIAYCPMLEPAYNSEYRQFRSKSKSWNGDGLGGATGRLKKSRSRLML